MIKNNRKRVRLQPAESSSHCRLYKTNTSVKQEWSQGPHEHIFPIEKEIATFHKLVKNRGYYFMFKILCRQGITDNSRLAAYNRYTKVLSILRESTTTTVDGEIDTNAKLN